MQQLSELVVLRAEVAQLRETLQRGRRAHEQDRQTLAMLVQMLCAIAVRDATGKVSVTANEFDAAATVCAFRGGMKPTTDPADPKRVGLEFAIQPLTDEERKQLWSPAGGDASELRQALDPT